MTYPARSKETRKPADYSRGATPLDELTLDDTRGLRALTTLCVLDTLPNEQFDRITRLARYGLQLPIAVVSVIDHDRHWLRTNEGLGPIEPDQWFSLCEPALQATGLVTITDLGKHPAYLDHPLVTGEPRVRFFAGHPIRGPHGSTLGALCVMDHRARSLSGPEEHQLGDLASLVEREIELMQSASTDELTALSNRRGFVQVAVHVLALCRRMRQPAVIATIDLDHFKPINDRYGHETGDRVLREFGKLLFRTFRDSDVIGRLGGDEFAVLCSGATVGQIAGSLARLSAEYGNSALAKDFPGLAFSAGLADFEPGSMSTLEDLLRYADERLYRAKAAKAEARGADAPAPTASLPQADPLRAGGSRVRRWLGALRRTRH